MEHILNHLFHALSTCNNISVIAYLAPPVVHHLHRSRGLQVIVVTLLCSLLAQLYKLVAKLIMTRRLDMRVLAKTGGMPSSHSSCTMGMAISVGLIDGFTSTTFAIALCLALIVMYDAAGIRRSVGLQARILNQMIEEMFSEKPHFESNRIKELLGHTPLEVLVGAAFGSAVACLINYWVTHCP